MPKRTRHQQRTNQRPGVPPNIVPCAPDATAGMARRTTLDQRTCPIRSVCYIGIRSLHLFGIAAALPLTIGFLHVGGRDVLAGWRLVALITSALITGLFNLALDQAAYPTHLRPALCTTGALYVNFAASTWLTGEGLYYGAYVGWLALLVALGLLLGGLTVSGLLARMGVRGAYTTVWEHVPVGMVGLIGAIACLALAGALGCAAPLYRELTALSPYPLEFAVTVGAFVCAVAVTTRAWWQCSVFSAHRTDPALQQSYQTFASHWSAPTAAAYVITVSGALLFLVWPPP